MVMGIDAKAQPAAARRFGTRQQAMASIVVFLVVVLLFCAADIAILAVGIAKARSAQSAVAGVEQKVNSLEGLLKSWMIVAIIVLILGLALAGFATTLFYKWLVGTSGEMTWQVQQVAAGDGDLTRQIQVSDTETFGPLADAINVMISALRGSIAEIGKIAGELNGSAEQMSTVIQEMNASSQDISNTIAHIARGGEEQARRVLDTSHAMEMMSSSMQEMAEKADLSNQAATEAIEIAERGCGGPPP